MIKHRILAPPRILRDDVECFSITESTGEAGVAIKVSPKCTPGIVFQHVNGRSAIENITTESGINDSIPAAFLYGPGLEPSVMNYRGGSYTTVHVILKPHALNSLLGMNASTLTDDFVELNEMSDGDLNGQLMEATDVQAQVELLTDFLAAQRQQLSGRDELIEEGLHVIHRDIAVTTVKRLLDHLHISERQFQRRFRQAVGVTPQSYMRVQRFNEAIRLIKGGRYERLTDVAHALNFYDQSHLIRDIKAFSGLTPRKVSQKEDDFHHTKTGYSFV